MRLVFLLFSTQSIGLQNVIIEKKPLDGGDYWLAMALGSFIHLETLPHFFIISLSAWNMFSLIHKKKKIYTFCPFMNLSAIIIYLVKYYG